MVLKDRIYGSFNVRDKVISDLLASPPMKRLADVSQMGPPDRYYHLKNYSRLEHSIGVMLLLRHLGAPLDEQLAGLVHDVSHTAFSHVIDWVTGTGEVEDYQDKHHKRSPQIAAVSEILKSHAHDARRIVHFKHFPLLEQEIPDLCADRIDYALREFPQQIAQSCFRNLTTYDGKIVFKNKKYARLFAFSFLKRQMEHWGGYEAVTRYYYFAKVLKRALALGLITWDDFSGNEPSLVYLLEKSPDRKIRELLAGLSKKDLSGLPKMRKSVRKKFRYVDPYFLEKGKPVQLSDRDMVFVELLIVSKKENDRGIRPGMLIRTGDQ